ncbi:hypothetical protein ECPA49_1601, partial [Escherichia coli PA49]
VSVN